MSLLKSKLNDISKVFKNQNASDNEKYEFTPEGVQLAHRNVDRAAIAQCMADMITDETLGVNASLGITNGGKK